MRLLLVSLATGLLKQLLASFDEYVIQLFESVRQATVNHALTDVGIVGSPSCVSQPAPV
jgi:hypothetical protein